MRAQLRLFLLAAVSLAVSACSWEHTPRIPARVQSSAFLARVSFDQSGPGGYPIPALGAPPGSHPRLTLALRLAASLDGQANRATEVTVDPRELTLVSAVDGSPVLSLRAGQLTDGPRVDDFRLPLDSGGSAEVALPINVPARDGDVDALCGGPLRLVGEAYDSGLDETIPVRGEPFVFDCNARHVVGSLAVLELRLVPPPDPALGVAELRMGLAETVSLDDAAAAPTLWLTQGVSPVALQDDQGERLVPEGGLDEPLERMESSPAGPVAIARGSAVTVTRQSRRYVRDATLVTRLCGAKVRVVDDVTLDEQSPDALGDHAFTAWAGELRSGLVAVDCHELAPP